MGKRFFLNMASAFLLFNAVLVVPGLLFLGVIGVFAFSVIELMVVSASFFIDSFSAMMATRNEASPFEKVDVEEESLDFYKEDLEQVDDSEFSKAG